MNIVEKVEVISKALKEWEREEFAPVKDVLLVNQRRKELRQATTILPDLEALVKGLGELPKQWRGGAAERPNDDPYYAGVWDARTECAEQLALLNARATQADMAPNPSPKLPTEAGSR